MTTENACIHEKKPVNNRSVIVIQHLDKPNWWHVVTYKRSAKIESPSTDTHAAGTNGGQSGEDKSSQMQAWCNEKPQDQPWSTVGYHEKQQ